METNRQTYGESQGYRVRQKEKKETNAWNNRKKRNTFIFQRAADELRISKDTPFD